jgi:hypothetical protein
LPQNIEIAALERATKTHNQKHHIEEYSMTKHTQINVSNDVINFIPLKDLYLSEMNPRQEANDEGILLLADSLVACGLIQNLAGFCRKVSWVVSIQARSWDIFLQRAAGGNPSWSLISKVRIIPKP